MSTETKITPEMNSIELLTKKHLSESDKAKNIPVFPALDEQLNKVDCYQKPQPAESRLPVNLSQRYFSVQNKFYFRTPPQSLAFTDKKVKLQTRLTNRKIVTDLLVIASNRQWSEVRLSGCQAFKKEAWYQAQTQGFKVTGYRPNEADLKRLSQSQEPKKSEAANQQINPKEILKKASEVERHLPEGSRQKFMDKVMQKIGITPKKQYDKFQSKSQEQENELER
ncbi:hypothetical protein D5R81_07750 [Parashewanella spongiae]|uniref:Large polyvalent protein-associated domain-containing protein n=1 Tax=Parashewanella spongiae TaxID=342950 RepID=A0A3A6U707_9GAMM|nr:LPD7 domain-containing protein [Parashewanella spongiae]MCL1077092.1 hypothetical protein [Parashewanella spongiae]RJY17673.1 hypothetical protein D5R81_07750 [Parashewanella spongiae]